MSAELLRQLADKRATVAAQSKALLDSADERKTDLTADENVSFDAATAEMIAIGKRMVAVSEADAQERSIAEALTRSLGDGNKGNGPAAEQDALFRSVARGEARSVDIAMPSVRTLSKATVGAGGNLVPTDFATSLLQHMVDTTSVLSLANVIQTSGGENFDLPITTSHGGAALVAENGTIAASDPVFGKRTLGAYKYGQLITVSTELVNDSAFDLVGYVAEAAGRNIGLAFGVDIAVGNGSSKPSGVVQTASTGVTGAASVVGVFTADNLIDLYYSVIAPYRNSPSAAWLVRDATLGSIRKLKDTAGRYLFESSTQGRIGALDLSEGTLLGKPIHTDPNIAATALSAKSVVFGDFSKFIVRLAGGVRFERSDEFAFNTDQVTFRALIRGDSILADQTGAVKVFVGNAA